MSPQSVEDGHKNSREGEEAYAQGDVEQIHGISFQCEQEHLGL
jgi:hypothetical protein